MDAILIELFKIVDDYCTLPIEYKDKIKDLADEKFLVKEQLTKVIKERPNDMELGNKVRKMFGC